MDISNFFSWFVNLMIEGMTYSFNLLDRLYLVKGVSVLDFMVACIVISVVVPVVLTVARAGYKNVSRMELKSTKQDSATSSDGGNDG